MISFVHKMPHSFFAGMDWKSMTMPASLPITTDYFPDKRSLQIDYVLSEYNMEPVVVNAELGERYVNIFHLKTSLCLDRIFNFLQCMHNYFVRFYDYVRQPLSPQQLYNEMVLQRIAQGFQLVIPNKKQIPASDSTPTTSIIRGKGKHAQPVGNISTQIFNTYNDEHQYSN